ncbi:MAG: rhomboid family intramembrane serine protease [Phycisphaerae bacterium]
MVLPIGTDVRLRSRPVGNYALIAINVLVFLLTNVSGDGMLDQVISPLNAAVPSVHEYVTYQFRHGDVMHLLGNMLFLYIFGNAVCDRMGSLNYVIFYLASGVFSGLMYALDSTNALVGASGSIAAVTTAFLALYPRVNITVLVFMIIITTLQLPAMILIVLKIILWDNVVAPRLQHGMVSNVAFSAHLAGYAFGFGATMLMLGVRGLPRNQFDMLALWSRWRRRVGLSETMSFPEVGRARPVAVEEIESRPLDAAVSPAMRLREDVVDRLYDNDVNEAMRLYEQMIAIDATLVLPRDHQRNIANQLARAQKAALAVVAYEGCLRQYAGAPDAGQIQLLLGMLCRRQLQDFARAAVHLRAAASNLHLDSHRELALDELARAEASISS